MSWIGLLSATISTSHPLHDPASTSRMARERPRTLWIVSRAFWPTILASVSTFPEPRCTAPICRCVRSAFNVYSAVRMRLRRVFFSHSNYFLVREAFSLQASGHKRPNTDTPQFTDTFPPPSPHPPDLHPSQ